MAFILYCPYINRDRFDFETIPNAIGAKVDNEIRDLIVDSPNLTKCFIYVSLQWTSNLDITKPS